MADRLTYAAAVAAGPGATLKCGEVRGLELRCKGRVKGWFYYYRFRGEPRRPKLGEFPTIGIDKARELARAMAVEVAAGIDPSSAKAAARRAPTLADLWELYNATHVAAKKESTAELYNLYWRVHIGPALGSHRVAEIGFPDVTAFLERLNRRGNATTNRVRALLGALMRFAELPHVAMRPPGSNPVQGTRKAKERKRRRHIRLTEFQAIGAGLREWSSTHPREVAAIFVILLSGARVSEVLNARVSDIDHERHALVLGEHKTDRSGDDRTIRLSSHAWALVSGLKPDRTGRLFPGIDRYTLRRRVWLPIVKAAGCPDLRLQDLRRTFASVTLSRGVDLGPIGDLLGHRQAQTTKGYAWLLDETAAELAQGTADTIAGLLKGGER